MTSVSTLAHNSILVEPANAKGVVYTRRWVVDLILDMIGYRPEGDLADLVAVEPAAGEGAFLIPMVRRLVASLAIHRRPLTDAMHAILAYELSSASAKFARDRVTAELEHQGISRGEAERAARHWITEGDYLLSSRSAPKADFVVGNPPYIRYDEIGEAAFNSYRSVCATMVGRCDLYVGFIEAGVTQLRPGGRLGYICADRWMRSAYGTALRRFIGEQASVEAVIEMHDAPAFEQQVSAYPAVTILRRGEQRTALVGSAGSRAGSLSSGASLADLISKASEPDGHRVKGFEVTKLSGWYRGDAPWPWAQPEVLNLIHRLEAQCGPLEDPATGTRVGIGVATGKDDVFVTSDPDVAEPDRLLPLAMAGDTSRGRVEWSGHYLVDPWGPDDKLIDLAHFPKLASYYGKHAGVLRARNIAARHKDGWYRTIDRVSHSLLRRDKLYFPDMKRETHPVLDRSETYPHHNLYFIVSDVWDLEVLGGLLLSKVAEMFVESYCVKMRGGTLRFQAQYLRRIRVPDPHAISADVRERLRRAFRGRDREAATAAAQIAYNIHGVLGLARAPVSLSRKNGTHSRAPLELGLEAP